MQLQLRHHQQTAQSLRQKHRHVQQQARGRDPSRVEKLDETEGQGGQVQQEAPRMPHVLPLLLLLLSIMQQVPLLRPALPPQIAGAGRA
jgi:hypothetical protein